MQEKEQTGLSSCYRHRSEFVCIVIDLSLSPPPVRLHRHWSQTGLDPQGFVASPHLRHTSFSLSSPVARRSSVKGGGSEPRASIPLAKSKKTEEEADISDPELLSHMASVASKLYLVLKLLIGGFSLRASNGSIFGLLLYCYETMLKKFSA
ncbi:hypothetical protein Bca52824_035428 [Brassica carinata]|uniref:Uncharacterized protein n=1 Tax=Brassica carinata TaxID=52824 RepID=A0A8X7V425_BRACI|nr:hypothetical protein Bca52824_035428 [Brassica carinata]